MGLTELLQLLPAVDVSNGQAVQQAGSSQTFADPVGAALRWQAAGAEWVHLVDLDAAFGRGSNSEVLHEVVAALSIDVEVSGGVRDGESLEAALATGCRRVILSTAALEDPLWCGSMVARHGDRIAVGLDVSGTTLAARGSGTEHGQLREVLADLEAMRCPRYVVTDVNKDGLLSGPNVTLLLQVCGLTSAPVIASGGVASLEDVSRLAALVSAGVEGAIIGTALYTGAFTLEDALRTAAVQRAG